MPEQVSHADVKAQLDDVVCPCAETLSNGYNVKEMGMLKSIDVSDGHVSINLRLTQPACFQSKYIRGEAEDSIQELSGVDSVSVDIDDGLDWRPDMMSEEVKRERRSQVEEQMEEMSMGD
jgi:metal-sulfur cluster biosynthetic enzyme